MKRAIASLVAALVASGPACQRKTHGKDDAVVVRRSVEELAKFVTLPATPTEVTFECVARGIPGGFGPTDYLLIAVMRFGRSDWARLTATAHRRPGSTPSIATTDHRPWFPAAVNAAIRVADDHSVTFRGEEFDGEPFAKAAFQPGFFIAIEGGEYVVLVLETR